MTATEKITLMAFLEPLLTSMRAPSNDEKTQFQGSSKF
jgi:hypothetical protein